MGLSGLRKAQVLTAPRQHPSERSPAFPPCSSEAPACTCHRAPPPLNTLAADGFAIMHTSTHIGTAHMYTHTRTSLAALCTHTRARTHPTVPQESTRSTAETRAPEPACSRGQGRGYEGLAVLCSTLTLGGHRTQAHSCGVPHPLFPPQEPPSPLTLTACPGALGKQQMCGLCDLWQVTASLSPSHLSSVSRSCIPPGGK